MSNEEMTNKLEQFTNSPFWKLSIAIVNALIAVIGMLLFSELKDLKQKDASLQTDIGVLRKEVRITNNETSTLKNRISINETRLEGINRDIENNKDNLNNRLERIEKQINIMNNNFKELYKK